MRRALTVLAISLSTLVSSGAAQARVTIFAASSLSSAVDQSTDLLPNSIDVATSYAGTQTLARQIIAGAPADIFISANQAWMDYVIAAGLVSDLGAHAFARNSLVAVAPSRSALTTHSLRAIGERPSLRVAMGDPETVPAGIYSKQALIGRDLWETFNQRLIVGSSVRSVLLWVERDEADIGFVYASDAKQSNKVSIVEDFSSTDHAPIVYTIAVLEGRERDEVREVFEHLMSAKTGDILNELGFHAP